jgi:glyoxylase-like metal-dependent hydrolase (beta-lactamase superfamily II)
MILRPFLRFETGCASYLFGCAGHGRCAVVDPFEEEVDAYLSFAESKKMKITHVLETHVHADHRSGGRALAARAGAAYGLHRSATVDFDFLRLDDGQEIELGNTRVRVLHTPGHTPEGVSFVVTDLRRGTDPWFVLTGDTLFIGAVGRPDLPGRARENAAELYDSVHQKLLTLPDYVEVLPAHFAGSACGAGMSGKPSSTIAFERRWNPLLSRSRDEFIAAIADGPARPALPAEIARMNQGMACERT